MSTSALHTGHPPTFYLASQSPRRQELLHQIGARFDVIRLRSAGPRGPDVCEDPLDNEPVLDYVSRVAVAKADFGRIATRQRHLPAKPVLGADTVVEIDGQILGKPSGAEEAADHLRRLSGRHHQVHTAICLSWEDTSGTHHRQRTVSSQVSFRSLTAADIAAYVACGEGLDKAGGYAVQGLAAVFVDAVRGSYSGIVGLPLCETAALLGEAGITLPFCLPSPF
jgi:septum formation protein